MLCDCVLKYKRGKYAFKTAIKVHTTTSKLTKKGGIKTNPFFTIKFFDVFVVVGKLHTFFFV